MTKAFYEPLVAKGYEWINTVADADYEIFRQFDGTRRGSTWSPVAVRRVRMDERSEFKPSAFPWLGADTLIMRRVAVEALRDLFDANGELLPLSTDDGVELFVFNAQVRDALDEAKSTVMKVPGTNRIMRVTKAVFIDSVLADADMFRLPHRMSATYVSERFVERVKAAKLERLVFNRVGT